MNRRSSLEEYERELKRHPTDYFGIINDLMDDGFSNAMFSISRDSDALEISNFETVKRILGKWVERSGWTEGEDGEDYYDGAVSIESSSHWAVGWVETIHVRMRNRKGEFTKAFRVACGLAEDLRNYCVLDEDDYSRREYEELSEYLEGEVGENAEELARHLFDAYSVSRIDDIRYEWIEQWKEEHYVDSDVE